MKKSTLLLIAVILGLMTGCSPSREKTVKRIKDLEKKLFSPEAQSFDKARADSLLALYEDFVKAYPKDSLAPGYLFKAANVAMNLSDGYKSITLFDQFIKDYPDHKKAAVCMFFKGFVYENVQHNLDKARETYVQFLEKYPENEFAKDANLALKNLGKTPEMLVREFEEQRKADSARVADSLAKTGKGKKRR